MEKEIISIELDPINDGLTGMPGSVESNASRFFVMGTNFEHRAISDSEYFGYIEQMGENGVTLIRGDYLIIYDARKSFTACDEDYLIGSFLLAKEREKLGEDGKPILDHDGEPVKETVQVTINAFKPVSTFDLSQTDGEPVPEFGPTELTGSVDGYATLFEAIKAIVPVPVTFEQIDSGAKGYFHTEDNRIAINEGMSEVQNIKTLIHEASHQKLHSKEAMKDGEPKSRNQKETEAEGIAYVVSSHFNIDCGDYTFPYLASWSSGLEVPELKASLDTIRSAASEMITAIEEKIQELTASKEQVSLYVAEYLRRQSYLYLTDSI